ncbi:GNAT family N-acetyltransferase [Paraburkholderia dilworthii]|uniref:GNAT family N-acetyltransferase n=1 Tax=Paraburkholderia dilworthii TaxID=948106 RepID=UPI000480E68C|nr:GNAT family protein [Paraburkholderia dilworthii]
MLIRPLSASDAPSFQSLRLAGLRDSPESFASSYEEEVDRSLDRVVNQLAMRSDHGVFGAFEGARLIAIAGLGRESPQKLKHKAFIWGVYVAPDMRGRGVSRVLLTEVLAFARAASDIAQVNLTVNANNAVAIGLYTSLGFEQFGIERNSMIVGGRYHDEIHLSIRLVG